METSSILQSESNLLQSQYVEFPIHQVPLPSLLYQWWRLSYQTWEFPLNNIQQHMLCHRFLPVYERSLIKQEIGQNFQFTIKLWLHRGEVNLIPRVCPLHQGAPWDVTKREPGNEAEGEVWTTTKNSRKLTQRITILKNILSIPKRIQILSISMTQKGKQVQSWK